MLVFGAGGGAGQGGWGTNAGGQEWPAESQGQPGVPGRCSLLTRGYAVTLCFNLKSGREGRPARAPRNQQSVVGAADTPGCSHGHLLPHSPRPGHHTGRAARARGCSLGRGPRGRGTDSFPRK